MQNKPVKLAEFITEKFDQKIHITYRRKLGHVQHYLHWHPHVEIQLIVEGSYTIINNNFNLASQKPIIIIHSPYTLHSGNADMNRVYESCIIAVDRRLIRTLPRDVTLMYAYPSEAELSELVGLAESMKARASDDEYASLYTALILKLTSSIIESGRGERICSSLTYIQDALRLVSERLSDPPTALELAAHFEVSKTKFHNDFRAATGTSYQRYLTDMRQTFAHDCILRGMSIITTALECGYSSEAHFIKAFREYWGRTPGAFQRGE